MSIPNLPVNFKDDILAATNQKRKYNLIQNDDGTVSFEDATEYQQTGSDFGAGQINATNNAINKIYSERILSLEEAALVTETGFFVDAMVVSELIGELNKNIEKVAESYGINVIHKKIGCQHTIRISGNVRGELTTHSFTIPEDCRPSNAVDIYTRANKTWCKISISKEGVVNIQPDSPIPVGTYINAWETYV